VWFRTAVWEKKIKTERSAAAARLRGYSAPCRTFIEAAAAATPDTALKRLTTPAG
jgi:hypothetical protein